MQNDPMHWKLTLARTGVNKDGAETFYYAKDTAANRNWKRFEKMDVRESQRSNHVGNIKGMGLTYDMPKPSRAMIEARALEGCAKAFATDAGSQRIVQPKVSRRMARLVARSI